MLLVGLVVGRLWAIPLGAVGWALLLLVTGVLAVGDAPLAMFLGGANVAVGIAVQRFVGWPLRRLRSAAG